MAEVDIMDPDQKALADAVREYMTSCSHCPHNRRMEDARIKLNQVLIAIGFYDQHTTSEPPA